MPELKAHPKTGLVAVTLLQPYATNVKGETAGFLPPIAKALIEKGMAHLPDNPPKEKSDKKASEPAALTTGDVKPGKDAKNG